MADPIHVDRNGCALHGAIRTLDAIKGVVPIVHANSGCSLNARFSANTLNAAVGRYFRGVDETSSTNLYDKHVVFGGTSRLREQIKNTIKVVNGDLYVVVTGCVPEVVGDDVPAMVKEARDQHFPVLGVATPGFKGNGYVGYQSAVRALLNGLPELFEVGNEIKPDRINLLGIAPEQDPYWEGDLLELEDVLASVGLEVNRLFGVGQDVKNWKNVPRAQLNVVLSPWGLDAAQLLKERYGTPYLYFGWLPVGSKDLALLLDRIAGTVVINEERLEAAQRRFDRRTRYFLQKLASAWINEDLQKEVSIVSSSAYAIGFSRFLAGTLGQHLKSVIISDDPPEDTRADIRAAIHELAPNADIQFSVSRDEISRHVLDSKPGFLIGSTLEAEDAKQLGISMLEISFPVKTSLILQRTYVGFHGALALVEDFGTAVRRKNAEQTTSGAAIAEVIAPKVWHTHEQLDETGTVINRKAS